MNIFIENDFRKQHGDDRRQNCRKKHMVKRSTDQKDRWINLDRCCLAGCFTQLLLLFYSGFTTHLQFIPLHQGAFAKLLAISVFLG